MMKRQESIIKEKSEAFSKRIVRLYRYLTQQKGETIISKQIYRSGTSIGANIAESRFAQSPADFISKLSIALKEANETEYWLKNLFYGDYITERQYTSMFNDVEEIIKILVKSIKTLKLKNGKL
jgi:four helix bundle protein